MLVAPPFEIIDLIEDVYDENGKFIKEKLSSSATPEQQKLFEQYQKDSEEILRQSFKADLGDKVYNPVDGWKMK